MSDQLIKKNIKQKEKRFIRAKVTGPITFCYMISFVNDVDIVQLVLEYQNSFGKCHPVFPKNP